MSMLPLMLHTGVRWPAPGQRISTLLENCSRMSSTAPRQRDIIWMLLHPGVRWYCGCASHVIPDAVPTGGDQAQHRG
jgi:hypothetical protein